MSMDMDRVSYALGMSVANNIKASGVKNLKVADFAAAMEDIFAGKRCRLGIFEQIFAIRNEVVAALRRATNHGNMPKRPRCNLSGELS